MSDNPWIGPAITAGLTAVGVAIRRILMSVTRKELDERIEKMHDENRAWMARIENNQNDIHDRIDQLYRDLINR